jgi:hypothetical protein
MHQLVVAPGVMATVDSAIRSANRANGYLSYRSAAAPADDGASSEALHSLADETDGKIVTTTPAGADLSSVIRAAVADGTRITC